MEQRISERKRKSPKRLAVIEAATVEFLERGYRDTSMDKIAETAQVSKRTVYDHFPSKDDLFQAIVDQIIARVDAMPDLEYSSEISIKKQLHEIATQFAETITDRKFILLCKAVLSHFIHSPEWAQNTLKAHDKTRKNMTHLFTRASEDGRLHVSNISLAASQFCGLIKESIFWPEIMAGQQPVDKKFIKEVVNSSVDLFLSHYQTQD